MVVAIAILLLVLAVAGLVLASQRARYKLLPDGTYRRTIWPTVLLVISALLLGVFGTGMLVNAVDDGIDAQSTVCDNLEEVYSEEAEECVPNTALPADDGSVSTSTSSTSTTSTTAVPASTIPPLDDSLLKGESDPSLNPDAELAPFEEVGPGACFPGAQILAQRRAQVAEGQFEDGIDFVVPWSEEELRILKGDEITWVRDNADDPCLTGLAKFIDGRQDYYEVNRVLLERWNRLNPDDQRTEWVFDLSVVQLADWFEEAVLAPVPAGGITILNHFYNHDDPTIVEVWKVQTLPEQELVWWLKGYEPGNGKNTLRPVVKFMCGNPLLPPPPPPPTDTSTTTTTEAPPCCDTPTTTTTAPPPPPPPPPPEEGCPPPVGVPPEQWDPVKCEKIPQTEDQQHNGDTGVRQDPQDNDTSGVDVGPTPGAPAVAPPVQPATPAPNAGTNTPAPLPTDTGSNSGSPSGSGTPVGSETDTSGTGTGSGATNDPEDSGQGGDNTGMPMPPPPPGG